MTSPDQKSERLQKFLARAGVASRRKAEILISTGRVKVNGRRTVLGSKVDSETDSVAVDGVIIRPASTATVAFAINKPPGYTCTNADPHAEKTVFALLPGRDRGQPGLHCAGRLDKASRGLLIITNDGDLTYALTHPSQKVLKYYRVALDRTFPAEKTPLLIRGVRDRGEWVKAESARPNPQKRNELEICLQHGKKREIRRLLQVLGFRVLDLERFQIGKYRLRGLALGSVKRLNDREKRLLLA